MAATDPRRATPALLSVRGLVMVAVFVLSGVVLFEPSPGTGALPAGTDKLVHTALFAALTASVVWWRQGVRTRSALLVAGALTAYAVGSEIVQAVLLPWRSGDPLDVVADLVGVAAVLVGAGTRARTRTARR